MGLFDIFSSPKPKRKARRKTTASPKLKATSDLNRLPRNKRPIALENHHKEMRKLYKEKGWKYYF